MASMAQVHFDVRHEFAASSERVWLELVDWQAHGNWIPMTRMEVEQGEPTQPGARFTAFTGFGRLALEDRMEVVDCEWDEAAASGSCTVAKLGPILRGRAWFTVSPKGQHDSVVDWNEDVTVPRTPQFLAPVVARLGALGFKMGMRRLAKQL